MGTMDDILFIFLMVVAFGGVWFFIKANQEEEN
jgi:preprotein translocase subunit YajC